MHPPGGYTQCQPNWPNMRQGMPGPGYPGVGQNQMRPWMQPGASSRPGGKQWGRPSGQTGGQVIHPGNQGMRLGGIPVQYPPGMMPGANPGPGQNESPQNGPGMQPGQPGLMPQVVPQGGPLGQGMNQGGAPTQCPPCQIERPSNPGMVGPNLPPSMMPGANPGPGQNGTSEGQQPGPSGIGSGAEPSDPGVTPQTPSPQVTCFKTTATGESIPISPQAAMNEYKALLDKQAADQKTAALELAAQKKGEALIEAAQQKAAALELAAQKEAEALELAAQEEAAAIPKSAIDANGVATVYAEDTTKGKQGPRVTEDGVQIVYAAPSSDTPVVIKPGNQANAATTAKAKTDTQTAATQTQAETTDDAKAETDAQTAASQAQTDAAALKAKTDAQAAAAAQANQTENAVTDEAAKFNSAIGGVTALKFW